MRINNSVVNDSDLSAIFSKATNRVILWMWKKKRGGMLLSGFQGFFLTDGFQGFKRQGEDICLVKILLQKIKM